MTAQLQQQKNPLVMLLVSTILLAASGAVSSNSIPMIDTKTGSILYNSQTTTTTSSTINYCYSIIGTASSSNNYFPPCETNILNIEEEDDCFKVSCPHATLSSENGKSSNSISSISTISSSMIVTGIQMFDLIDGDNNILETRFARTLNSIFVQALSESSSKEDDKKKRLLLVAVDTTSSEDNQEILDEELKKNFMNQLQQLFDICVLSRKGIDTNDGDTALEDYFTVELIPIQSNDDAQSVIQKAKEYASKNSSPSNSNVILSNVIQKYNKLRTSSTTSKTTTDPPILTEAQYTCESAYFRQIQLSTNRFTSWKNRIARGLSIDKYGLAATTLLKRSLAGYDRETLSTVGLSSTSQQCRFNLRLKLEKNLGRTIQELYYQQMEFIEKMSLQQFQSTLVRNNKKKTTSSNKEYDNNAAAIRAAVFAYDTIVSNLEIPTLNLYKTKHIQTFESKLYNTLSSIEETTPSQLMKLDTIGKKSAKSQTKAPKDKSVNVGVSLVSMIRPDGFGNMQGFVGYNLGPHSCTVGYHNDADAPETISSFGGVKPPLLRIQPKLNFDIEL